MTQILQRRRHTGARVTIEVNESRNNLQGILGVTLQTPSKTADTTRSDTTSRSSSGGWGSPALEPIKSICKSNFTVPTGIGFIQ